MDIWVDTVDMEWIKMGAWILPPAIHRAFGGLPEGDGFVHCRGRAVSLGALKNVRRLQEVRAAIFSEKLRACCTVLGNIFDFTRHGERARPKTYLYYI